MMRRRDTASRSAGRGGRPIRSRSSMIPERQYIDGRFVASHSARTIDVINPATQEVIARVSDGDRDDIDAAVAAARRAFESAPWNAVTAQERGRILFRLAQAVREHAAALAELET